MTLASNWLAGLLRRASQSEAVDETAATGATTTTGGEQDQEPVVVWEAANLMEAEVVKGRLTSAGIPAIVRAEALGAIYGLTTGTLAAAAVLVPAPLADKALDLLHGDEEVEGEIDETGSDES
ncbi:MAG: hypothetical protein DCC55_16320 [Chloroflexi bacterium]|nr:MAG: hypothetical protein DCC55_16320 [Chloroflexota bacterium]